VRKETIKRTDRPAVEKENQSNPPDNGWPSVAELSTDEVVKAMVSAVARSACSAHGWCGI
jgi:hypothetical protein